MRHLRTLILLTAAAGLLAACAQSPAGLERAAVPAHAIGEGVPGSAPGVTIDPPAPAMPVARRVPARRSAPAPAAPAADHQHHH